MRVAKTLADWIARTVSDGSLLLSLTRALAALGICDAPEMAMY